MYVFVHLVCISLWSACVCVFPCVCLALCDDVSILPLFSLCVSECPYVSLVSQCFCKLVRGSLFACICMCASMCWCICFVCLHLSVCVCACPAVSVYVFAHVCPSVCLIVCLHMYVYVCVSVCMPMCVCLHFFCVEHAKEILKVWR